MDLHPTVWRNRQSSRLYRAFSELWGADALYVSRDRILFKHPVLDAAPAWGQRESPHPFGGFLHWDWGGWVDENASMLERPWFKVQGMLALADTSAEQGGFQCVPGVHRKLPELFEAIPALREPGNQGMATIAEHLDAATLARLGLEVRRVPLRAGDLVVWHHCTLHGSSQNRTGLPRLSQAITFIPPDHPQYDPGFKVEGADGTAVSSTDRMAVWENAVPSGYLDRPFAGVADAQEVHTVDSSGADGVLTPLGRRLMGATPWPEGASGTRESSAMPLSERAVYRHPWSRPYAEPGPVSKL